MAEGYKRAHLQALAEAKLQDSQLLLANKRYGNAFYLAGYAVELALKACIAKRIVTHVIPDKAFIVSINQHNLKNLVGVAGLTAELKAEQGQNKDFATYWAMAGEWGPEARYDGSDPYSSQLFVQAVGDPKSGILRWIRQHW